MWSWTYPAAVCLSAVRGVLAAIFMIAAIHPHILCTTQRDTNALSRFASHVHVTAIHLTTKQRAPGYSSFSSTNVTNTSTPLAPLQHPQAQSHDGSQH